MKSTPQFLKIIGCIILLTLGAYTAVSSCFSNNGIVNDLMVMSEGFKDHCKYTLTNRG